MLIVYNYSYRSKSCHLQPYAQVVSVIFQQIYVYSHTHVLHNADVIQAFTSVHVGICSVWMALSHGNSYHVFYCLCIYLCVHDLKWLFLNCICSCWVTGSKFMSLSSWHFQASRPGHTGKHLQFSWILPFPQILFNLYTTITGSKGLIHTFF